MKEKPNYASPELKEFTVLTVRMIASSPMSEMETITTGDSAEKIDEAF